MMGHKGKRVITRNEHETKNDEERNVAIPCVCQGRSDRFLCIVAPLSVLIYTHVPALFAVLSATFMDSNPRECSEEPSVTKRCKKPGGIIW